MTFIRKYDENVRRSFKENLISGVSTRKKMRGIVQKDISYKKYIKLWNQISGWMFQGVQMEKLFARRI